MNHYEPAETALLKRIMHSSATSRPKELPRVWPWDTEDGKVYENLALINKMRLQRSRTVEIVGTCVTRDTRARSHSFPLALCPAGICAWGSFPTLVRCRLGHHSRHVPEVMPNSFRLSLRK